MHSISSSARSLPTSVGASHRLCRDCRSTYLQTFWGGGVGGGGGTGGASQPEKHLSCRRRCDQTNQQRLENMISPGEECGSRGASRPAHTGWLCEQQGMMGGGRTQLLRAHGKASLSAQGVWAEHLQLCSLILGKVTKVPVTYLVRFSPQAAD